MVQKNISIRNTSEINNLFIETGRNYFAIFSTDALAEKINGLEVFTFNKSISFAEVFQAVALQSFLMENKEALVNVAFQNPYAYCIPNEYYNEEQTEYYRELLNASYSALDYASVMNNLTVKYFVPEEMVNLLKRNFSSLRVTHKYSTIIRQATKNISDKENYVYVVFYEQVMIVTVFKNNALQIINSFEFTTETDVAYHLLNVIAQIDIDKNNVQLILSGQISAAGNLYALLYTYFSDIIFDESANAAMPDYDATNHLEAHYFSPYLCNIAYFEK